MIGENLIGKRVIVRCNRAGVFYGTLAARDGQEVELHDVRRLWRWSGAASLSQLALEGVNNPDGCRFTMTVNNMVLLEAIEIIPCTDKAMANIDRVPVWKIC